MKIEVKVPEVGEAVKEALLAEWYKKDGDTVAKGEILFLIETDKVTLEVAAEADGVLEILVKEGETVPVKTVVARIETDAAGAGEAAAAPGPAAVKEPPKKAAVEAPAEAPAKEEKKPAPEAAAPSPKPAQGQGEVELSEFVRALLDETGIDPAAIKGTGPGGRVTRGDVLLHMEEKGVTPPAAAIERTAKPGAARPAAKPPAPRPQPVETGDEVTRKAMSPIRRRIAERLLESRQNTAALTTFNEIDMSAVQGIRRRLKEGFRERYGVSLGLMSFFVKACVTALKEVPEVNAFIDGGDIVYHHRYHIGMAIGAERGLVVPVIRNADRLAFHEIERAIDAFATKVKENRLELTDLEGGTFTISNGGVFGSLLSTPILNTPQSGILGLHRIEDRPVVVGGEIVIRPMMYVALTYDHRIIDGREAVTFLKRVKECVENPERIMLEV